MDSDRRGVLSSDIASGASAMIRLIRRHPAEMRSMATDLSAAPSLETGDHLTREEFLRIWEQLPHVKRAELIGGIVYLPSPLRREHGKTDYHITTWLGVYEAATPGCEGGSNTTSLIEEDCPQPDDYLALLPECGGASWGEKYVEGAPELIAEISFSSVSIDIHEKFDLYQRAGVQEYLVAMIKKQEIRWHRLVKGKYKLIAPDTNGIYRSQVFPGLWLDSKALFKGDMARVLATLQKGIASEEHQQFVEELASRKRKSKR
jgi:Putative restriction endonuclease